MESRHVPRGQPAGLRRKVLCHAVWREAGPGGGGFAVGLRALCVKGDGGDAGRGDL